MSFTERDATPEERADDARWIERRGRLRHLYRYRSLRGEGFARFYDVVVRSELYFSSYLKLNDPFDGGVWPTPDGTEQEKRAWWERHVRECSVTQAQVDGILALPADEERKVMRTALAEELAKLGVACFSETGDDLPMWAYYADSHSGVCLRFRAASLLGWEGCSPTMPITYEDEYPKVAFYSAKGFRRVQTMLVTKAELWSHEKEWRIVRHAGHGVVQFDPSALDGVVLGCRIEGADEDRVKDLIARRRPKIELLKAAPAERAFRLDIRPA